MTFTLIAFRPDDVPHMDSARRIRQTVFCEEQGVSPDEEWDGKDAVCEHFLVLENGAAIGCARLRSLGPGLFKIERVAVLKERRDTGAGKAIMRDIMARLGKATVVLNAQLAVEEFYSRLGFVGEGEVFEEAGISHIHMIWRPRTAAGL